MSRLRRLLVSDSWFFITCRVLPSRGFLTASEFACLSGVIHERRKKHGFLLIYLNPVKAGLAKRGSAEVRVLCVPLRLVTRPRGFMFCYQCSC